MPELNIIRKSKIGSKIEKIEERKDDSVEEPIFQHLNDHPEEKKRPS